MIGDLKPYPAYKDSGVAWLKEIPEHWDIKRNKLFLQEASERSQDGFEDLLTVSQYTGVSLRRERFLEGKGLLTTADSLVGYKQVSAGDLVINIMLAWNGSLGVAPLSGIVSPAYCVFRFKANISPLFFHYLLRTLLFTGVFKTVSTGVVDSRLRLYPDKFLRLPSLLPPFEEQTAIATFLEYVDRRIRCYIRSKQKLIKLLEEQKQVVINEVVTHGLDPNVPMKRSGVEWLGDIPEHWNVEKLKRFTTAIEQGWSPQCYAWSAGEDEWGVLKVGCVNGDNFNPKENKKLPTSLNPDPSLEIRGGDILVSRANTQKLVGLAALSDRAHSKILLCDKLFRFQALQTKMNPQFLVYVIRDKVGRSQIESKTNGASDSMQNIGQGVIRNLLIPVPPLLEQQQIVEFLSSQVTLISTSTSEARRQIALLSEFRTRLIADVVTGKLDVREAAAKLPTEINDLEPIDEDLDEDSMGLEDELDPDAAPEDDAA